MTEDNQLITQNELEEIQDKYTLNKNKWPQNTVQTKTGKVRE